MYITSQENINSNEYLKFPVYRELLQKYGNVMITSRGYQGKEKNMKADAEEYDEFWAMQDNMEEEIRKKYGHLDKEQLLDVFIEIAQHWIKGTECAVDPNMFFSFARNKFPTIDNDAKKRMGITARAKGKGNER